MPETAPEPIYLTARQASDLLRVNEKTVQRWSLQDASMPVLRRGRVVRFPRERLLAWSCLRGRIGADLSILPYYARLIGAPGASRFKANGTPRRPRSLASYAVTRTKTGPTTSANA